MPSTTSICSNKTDENIRRFKDEVVFTPHIAFYSQEALDRILRIEPHAGNAWADKGYLHLLLNERIEGITALQQSLKLQPRKKKDWELLAIAFMASELWKEAVAALENAIHLDPNAAINWYNLAACKFIIGDQMTGIAAAQHAASIDPTIESILDDWEIFEYENDEEYDDDSYSVIIAG